ncbi:MAG TPA: hypothetical protein VHJ38_15990, partial [Nitrososphaeraceae archaeon]|nr:hypothetical protein [Nitrososphaeraceae archaeon]
FPLQVSVGYNIEGETSFKIRSLKTFPPLPFPGTHGARVEANIQNTGDVAASKTLAKVELPNGIERTWAESDSFYIGRILPGQNANTSFFLNVYENVTSNVLPLNINLFHDNGNNTLPTALSIGSKARFELVDVEDSSQLYPGATNVPIRVTLNNTGNAIAEGITTKLLAGNIIPGVRSNIQTTIGNIEDIGNVIPGETFTTTFIVNVASSVAKAGKQVGSIELKWTQPGVTYTLSAESPTYEFIDIIPISYTIEQGPNYLLYYNDIPLTYVVLFVIVILMIILFIIVRRRRNRIVEKNSSYNISENEKK